MKITRAGAVLGESGNEATRFEEKVQGPQVAGKGLWVRHGE
jgi:hypothetical protein